MVTGNTSNAHSSKLYACTTIHCTVLLPCSSISAIFDLLRQFQFVIASTWHPSQTRSTVSLATRVLSRLPRRTLPAGRRRPPYLLPPSSAHSWATSYAISIPQSLVSSPSSTHTTTIPTHPHTQKSLEPSFKAQPRSKGAQHAVMLSRKSIQKCMLMPL